MDNYFAGKRILVTGASGLIGTELVRHFLGQGSFVVAQVKGHPLEIPADTNLSSITADLAKVGAGRELVVSAGEIDFVINCAARQDVSFLRDLDSGLAADVFQVNVLAATEIMIQARAQGAQALVNISSIEAISPRVGHSVYGASKAALEALTRSGAVELAPMRINALRLGLIGRPGIERDWPEGVAAWNSRSPLARFGTAEEVCGAVEFLLSQKSAWCTGAILDFDGGMGAVSRW